MEAAQLLVRALVISCLNYCNRLLAKPPASAVKSLQHIQNSAARLVSDMNPLSSPAPPSLHASS